MNAYAWGATIAISLIAVTMQYLIFSPHGIREILQIFSEEQKHD